MGLDMYAYIKSAQGSEEFKSGNEEIEIAYWRKHNALHLYMERLYNKKIQKHETEVDTDINCVDVFLDKEDLLALEKQMDRALLLQVSELEAGSGFFYGDTSYMENGQYESYYYPEDKKFIEFALEALAEGHTVFYNANY